MLAALMIWAFRAAAVRVRVVLERLLSRLGLGDDAFLILLAIAVGAVTAAAAVGFHELIDYVRDLCYVRLGERMQLFRQDLWLLVVLPGAGGLLVGLIARYVYRGEEGSGVIDVMESVGRSTGGVKVRSALEKIVTSAISIGTGGSAGAEGPIVTIGAAIAAAIGRIFSITRQHMPILTGCGAAAGISAIFNAPIGGVLFTLEVILHDFSIRAFAPVVLASVVANVATQEIYRTIDPGHSSAAIFRTPADIGSEALAWIHLPSFLLLGLLCGVLGVTLTKCMRFVEQRFARMQVAPVLRPALGGLLLGVMGGMYIMAGWFALGTDKPVDPMHYPMPAFFGDGYPVVQRLLSGVFFNEFPSRLLLPLLIVLVLAKLVGTCLTLGSGGSGGIIAPSLFLGAAGGALLGVALRSLGIASGVPPQVHALIGMGAVLAAVVHAPLASILILFEVTRDPRIMLPAMLASIVATGVARAIFADSIYTMGLRQRGVSLGSMADLGILRRLTVEQVNLEPASVLKSSDPFQRVLDLTDETGVSSFVVVDRQGLYAGMIVMDDIRTVLLQREAVPLLLVGELMRTDVPLLSTGDDLATVLESFTRRDVSHLPVSVSRTSRRVIGMISRVGVLRRYQAALSQSR
jgi:CIC family chloride channel protein